MFIRFSFFNALMRWSFRTALFVLSALWNCAAWSGALSDAAALSLEQFEHPLEVTCSSNSTCSRSIRSKTTLGAYTGIVIRGGNEMNSRLLIEKGVMTVHGYGDELRSVTISWDSDTYADQLSSAGLQCVDLKGRDASAIVLKDFKVSGICGESKGECSRFIVETRIYDASDPTGQTYSASVLRVMNDREQGDLLIPFSNFTRKGLRGEARIGCVGAVSIQIKLEGYSDATLKFGRIYTNSSEPFESLIFTPTPLPRIEPTSNLGRAIPLPANTPSLILTPTPTPTPILVPVQTPRSSVIAQVVPTHTIITEPLERDELRDGVVFGAVVGN